MFSTFHWICFVKKQNSVPEWDQSYDQQVYHYGPSFDLAETDPQINHLCVSVSAVVGKRDICIPTNKYQIECP